MAKQRVFSGLRPTAESPHLGNWLGALNQWVNLQDEYDCFFSIVDWHALTTSYDDTTALRENTLGAAINFLSAGLDPKKSPIFVQSHVPEHVELHILLSMITPISWLERCPTYKDQMIQLGKEGKDLSTYGFLGYPVLMASDILIYKASVVPVGEDQAPHLELAREIARRFNYLYGKVFPEPQIRLSEVPMLPGIDGRKMSKSYGNFITMSAETEEIKEKVRLMITDPQRIRKTDPGNPDICVVYAFQKIFNSEETSKIEQSCRSGEIGCVECKRILIEKMDQRLTPIREKRKELANNPGLVEDILADGAARAREVARQTLEEVKEKMGLLMPKE
ncbi:MAG TPA: tryptophan--tRNA ligase [Clostridia bacterium]|nr:tryptophan--tRNA ligase [Clostridia bacterium]